MKVLAIVVLICSAISVFAAPKPNLIDVVLGRASSTDFQCLAPNCNSDAGWAFLWPHSDTGCFYQCTSYGPVVHRCAPGSVFGFRAQVCVFERDFEQALDNCP